jgi:site-specific DNA recombinase
MTPRQLCVARELAAGQPQIVQDRRCRTLRHCVSGDEQVESGLSLEAQEQIAHGFWQRNLQGKGLEWGGLWADEAVSAFKRPLLRRPNGQKFVTVAKPGDHIVVTRFDRCFRSMLDFVNTFRLLETRGIVLHILDAPGDPATANGRAMLQMLCVFAEWESRVKSERVKAAMVILRQQGKHTGGKPPWGYKVVGPKSNPAKGVKGNRRLAPDWEERALMLEIVRLRDVERISCWETIAARMRHIQRDARRAGIDNPALFRREWSWESCQRAYAAFWTVLVEKEGTSWIADPTIKNLAEVRLAEG